MNPLDSFIFFIKRNYYAKIEILCIFSSTENKEISFSLQSVFLYFKDLKLIFVNNQTIYFHLTKIVAVYAFCFFVCRIYAKLNGINAVCFYLATLQR